MQIPGTACVLQLWSDESDVYPLLHLGVTGFQRTSDKAHDFVCFARYLQVVTMVFPAEFTGQPYSKIVKGHNLFQRLALHIIRRAKGSLLVQIFSFRTFREHLFAIISTNPLKETNLGVAQDF